jgi:hypothetical protein
MSFVMCLLRYLFDGCIEAILPESRQWRGADLPRVGSSVGDLLPVDFMDIWYQFIF